MTEVNDAGNGLGMSRAVQCNHTRSDQRLLRSAEPVADLLNEASTCLRRKRVLEAINVGRRGS